jgi:hypothetical protein
MPREAWLAEINKAPLKRRTEYKRSVIEHGLRLRWNWFRLHCQYLMAADRCAAYDYVLLVGGPAMIGEWAKHPVEFTRALHVQLLRRSQSPGTDT